VLSPRPFYKGFDFGYGPYILFEKRIQFWASPSISYSKVHKGNVFHKVMVTLYYIFIHRFSFGSKSFHLSFCTFIVQFSFITHFTVVDVCLVLFCNCPQNDFLRGPVTILVIFPVIMGSSKSKPGIIILV